MDDNQNNPQDDKFPGFLNDPANQGQAPSFLSDSANQGQSSAPTSDPQVEQLQSDQVAEEESKVIVTGGSPEVPAVIEQASEQGSEKVESGNEILPPVEKGVEEKEKIENKEKRTDALDKQGDLAQVVNKQPEEEQIKKEAQIFGYMIPSEVLQDHGAIKSKKSKGSPNSSSRWLYMLLDRMLKVHSK